MKKTAIATAVVSGIAAAILFVLGLRKNGQVALTDEKLHQLQDKFKSLDVA